MSCRHRQNAASIAIEVGADLRSNATVITLLGAAAVAGAQQELIATCQVVLQQLRRPVGLVIVVVSAKDSVGRLKATDGRLVVVLARRSVESAVGVVSVDGRGAGRVCVGEGRGMYQGRRKGRVRPRRVRSGMKGLSGSEMFAAKHELPAVFVHLIARSQQIVRLSFCVLYTAQSCRR
jgi:hypothetical protein